MSYTQLNVMLNGTGTNNENEFKETSQQNIWKKNKY